MGMCDKRKKKDGVKSGRVDMFRRSARRRRSGDGHGLPELLSGEFTGEGMRLWFCSECFTTESDKNLLQDKTPPPEGTV